MNIDHKHTTLSLNTWAAFAEILSTGFFPETRKISLKYRQTKVNQFIALIPSGQPKTPNHWGWVQQCQKRRWWGCDCLSTVTALAMIAGWTCCSRYDWNIQAFNYDHPLIMLLKKGSGEMVQQWEWGSHQLRAELPEDAYTGWQVFKVCPNR